MRQTSEYTMKFSSDSLEEPSKALACPRVLPVGCVIMASGLSRRFGSNKLLADFHGKPVLAHVIETVKASPFFRTVVVTRSPETAELCGQYDMEVLLHDRPGRNDTVRLGLQAILSHTSLSGCVFCPGDQPLLTSASLKALIAAFSGSPNRICRLGYENAGGAPVLFGQNYFPELLSLPEGKGGSLLTKKYPAQVKTVPAQDIWELYDIDTPEDLALLLRHSPR